MHCNAYIYIELDMLTHTLYRDIEKLMMCGLKFSGKFVPEIISSSTLKKFDVVVDRLGISKFKNKFADFLG